MHILRIQNIFCQLISLFLNKVNFDRHSNILKRICKEDIFIKIGRKNRKKTLLQLISVSLNLSSVIFTFVFYPLSTFFVYFPWLFNGITFGLLLFASRLVFNLIICLFSYLVPKSRLKKMYIFFNFYQDQRIIIYYSFSGWQAVPTWKRPKNGWESFKNCLKKQMIFISKKKRMMMINNVTLSLVVL